MIDPEIAKCMAIWKRRIRERKIRAIKCFFGFHTPFHKQGVRFENEDRVWPYHVYSLGWRCRVCDKRVPEPIYKRTYIRIGVEIADCRNPNGQEYVRITFYWGYREWVYKWLK